MCDDDDSFESFVRFKRMERMERENETKTFSVADPLDSKAKFELLFALDAWYEPLAEFTAKTSFLPLSLADVNSLLKPNGDVAALEAQIDDELVKHFAAGAFCKLQTRSPKDAVVRLAEPMLSQVRQRMLKSPFIQTSKQRRLLANADANLISVGSSFLVFSSFLAVF